MAKIKHEETIPEQTDRNTRAGDDTLALATKTLTGDIRDFLLDRLRNQHDARPWNERKEKEQRDTINEATEAARHLVEQAVRIIAADGRKVIVGTVTQITIKDGIKALIEVPRHDAMRHDLSDSQGQSVLVVVSDASAFEGMRAEVKATPDQADIESAIVVHSSDDDTGETDYLQLEGPL